MNYGDPLVGAVCTLLVWMSFGSFSLWELTCTHCCVCLALWTRKVCVIYVLDFFFLNARYKFSLIHKWHPGTLCFYSFYGQWHLCVRYQLAYQVNVSWTQFCWIPARTKVSWDLHGKDRIQTTHGRMWVGCFTCSLFAYPNWNDLLRYLSATLRINQSSRSPAPFSLRGF